MTQFLIGIGPIISPLIYIVAAASFVLLVVSNCFACNILKQISMNNELDYKNFACKSIKTIYTISISLISILPLLGMFGTVISLLSLDITSGATDELKNNFFLALDTTAAGLFSSIILKIINSFMETKIETAIEKIDILIKSHYTKKESSKK